ncbi:MAG TPA: N-acetyl sugar amidotransferase [Planctomycetaceae bacterium]|nr:N-acetyl sugar amidotransferase [Planctomycetaceae bacterium]
MRLAQGPLHFPEERMNEQTVHLKAAITTPPSTLNTRQTSASVAGPATSPAQRQVCQRCVMDSSAENIRFDANGVCHFCRDFLQKQTPVLDKSDASRSVETRELIDRIKSAGRRKRYDCVVGVSGGIDSSYVLHLAVEHGLRPLAVHMDNNWNSEAAANNIKNLVTRLGVDLYTHVIEWQCYRSLLQAFLDADVVDIELLYDNASQGVVYRQAKKHGIRHMLMGFNAATEGLMLPRGWRHFKWDLRNIRDIARSGSAATRKFPGIGIWRRLYYHKVCRMQQVRLLNYVEFNKSQALELLEERYDYKRYQYKHYESILTRFYQGYLLPVKFGIDKRRVHASTLIMTGEMTRAEALEMLEGPAYDPAEIERDRKYFVKKMGWTENQLDDYLARPPRSHDEFRSDGPLWTKMRQLRGR